MSEWWTYGLSDFLLFSPRVYYRLFELHNRALWPAHILTLLLGLAILVLLVRPARGRDRLILGMLGALWLWIAWAFFWQRYATINWAAPYVAPAFGLEGLLLIWFGAARRQVAFLNMPDGRTIVGLALFALCLLGYPLLTPLMGRPWLAAEIFGIAPDPTAVATIAVLALAQGRTRWLLLIIPVSWCVVTGATLWTMEAGDFFVAPAGALAAVVLSVMGRHQASAAPPPSARVDT